ncbi:MAG: hypothetical protein ACFFED_12995 [Candidatus Thorarchaeota archaeon]
MTDCPICGRKGASDSEFCAYHDEALTNIKVAFDDWERAMGINWDDYLRRLQDEEYIGKWAREVVEYAMRQDDS